MTTMTRRSRMAEVMVEGVAMEAEGDEPRCSTRMGNAVCVSIMPTLGTATRDRIATLPMSRVTRTASCMDILGRVPMEEMVIRHRDSNN